jgi:hypothetical protein
MMIDSNVNARPREASKLKALLSKLKSVQSTDSNKWKACCPAHSDRKPSLSIRVANDGKILIHCHAGCPTEKVVTALGMSMSDLFLDSNDGRSTDNRKSRRTFATLSKAVAELKRSYGKPSGRWRYLDADGNPVGVVLRWDPPDANKFYRPLSRNGDSWVIGGMPEPRPLYRLPELAAAERVYVTEGEKAADVARYLRLTATTSSHGAKSAGKTDWSPLAGKEVIILPDNNGAGRDYAADVARILAKLEPAPKVKVVELDNLPDSGDIADWFAGWRKRDKTEKQMKQRIEKLTDEAEEFRPPEPDETAEPVAEGEPKKGKKSAATKLIEMTSGIELWHTPDLDAYATITADGHRENWSVRSKSFKRWLGRQFYLREGKAPRSQEIADALLVIEGRAIHEGGQHQAHVRVAEYEGNIFVDLCNKSWQAVRVTTDGWSIVDDPPIRFRRAKAMIPLPTPSDTGSVDDLRKFLNVTDEGWPLVVAWLLATMRPTGPYPVLCLHGEQGSAKSTAARVLRELVDPNTAPLRSSPREPRDLMIAAHNGWVIALDNLSSLPPWFSDALCRLSTGGGFSTRELYADKEETIFNAMRPIVVTGIEEVATRGDLLDRALLVTLPTIPDDRRQSESEFWRDFNKCKDRLFGAILMVVSEALANLPNVSLDRVPRMADFAMWSTAGETALGLEEGEFLRAYAGNRESANELVLESSPVTRYVVEMAKGLAENDCWEGRATDLLEVLERKASDGDKRLKSWPNTPRALSGCLRRLAPNLRQAGIEVEFGEVGRGNQKRRNITIRRTETKREEEGFLPPPRTPTVPVSEKQGSSGDGRGRPGTIGDGRREKRKRQKIRYRGR